MRVCTLRIYAACVEVVFYDCLVPDGDSGDGDAASNHTKHTHASLAARNHKTKYDDVEVRHGNELPCAFCQSSCGLHGFVLKNVSAQKFVKKIEYLLDLLRSIIAYCANMHFFINHAAYRTMQPQTNAYALAYQERQCMMMMMKPHSASQPLLHSHTLSTITRARVRAFHSLIQPEIVCEISLRASHPPFRALFTHFAVIAL